MAEQEPIPLGTDFSGIPEEDKNEIRVVTKLRREGLSPTATAALIGNIAVETGGSFDHEQVEQGTEEGDNPARGLFQFEEDGLGLAEPYGVYLQERSAQDSPEAQLQFMVDTINGNYQPGADWIGQGNIDAFREASEHGDLEQATKIFQEKILRPSIPHQDRRTEAAREAWNEYFLSPETETPATEQMVVEEANRIRAERENPEAPKRQPSRLRQMRDRAIGILSNILDPDPYDLN